MTYTPYTGWDSWDIEDDGWGTKPLYNPIVQNTIGPSHPLFNPELIWDFLNQKKVWVNRALLEIPIKEMDKSYLFNVLKWADKNYQEINFTLAFALKLRKFTSEQYIDIQTNGYPLFEKIERRYLKLNGVKPVGDTSV